MVSVIVGLDTGLERQLCFVHRLLPQSGEGENECMFAFFFFHIFPLHIIFALCHNSVWFSYDCDGDLRD